MLLLRPTAPWNAIAVCCANDRGGDGEFRLEDVNFKSRSKVEAAAADAAGAAAGATAGAGAFGRFGLDAINAAIASVPDERRRCGVREGEATGFADAAPAAAIAAALADDAAAAAAAAVAAAAAAVSALDTEGLDVTSFLPLSLGGNSDTEDIERGVGGRESMSENREVAEPSTPSGGLTASLIAVVGDAGNVGSGDSGGSGDSPLASSSSEGASSSGRGGGGGDPFNASNSSSLTDSVGTAGGGGDHLSAAEGGATGCGGSGSCVDMDAAEYGDDGSDAPATAEPAMAAADASLVSSSASFKFAACCCFDNSTMASAETAAAFSKAALAFGMTIAGVSGKEGGSGLAPSSSLTFKVAASASAILATIAAPRESHSSCFASHASS